MVVKPVIKVLKGTVKNPWIILVVVVFAYSYLLQTFTSLPLQDELSSQQILKRHRRSSAHSKILVYNDTGLIQNATSEKQPGHNETKHHIKEEEDPVEKRFQVASVNWGRVASPYIISAWIIVAGLVKIGFHLIHKVVSRVPESCVLICVGLVVGGVAYSVDKHSRIEQLLFNPDTFFLFILPPIVMEAGYFMPKESFFENVGTILTYAIVGTIFNAMAIGFSLYGVYLANLMPGIEEVNLLHCLLFGSIISAVDPVAVISVFEEIHVNSVLYICVFGESLLNDGVAVVLFKLFESYIEIGEDNIIGRDIIYGLLSFFIVAFGALLIGIAFGYLGAFITKYTVHNRIVEPTFVFVVCYMSYLTAEVFHLSGIIAIVFAAFTMSSYVEQNISAKSHTTVKYGMKMLANIAETIIFMLLGIAAVSDFWQHWNTGFVLWTLLFITLYRFIGVYVLTAIANSVRLDKINKVDQFVMAYGGLRGAIAFSLVSLTSDEHVPAIKSMICACIVAILFTSFIQGSTIRPIVDILKVKTANNHEMTMFEDINIRLIEHLMAGVEDITGHHGHHHWMQRLHDINVKYLAKWLIREPYKTRHEEIFDTFHRINRRDAEEMVEDFERGSSSGDLRQTPTLTNLLLPMEMRRSFSQASFNNIMREHSAPEACIDMNALHLKSKEATKSTEAADVHHLLEQYMYKPRIRERTRHPRGNIDDDNVRKKQEQEIIFRHRVNLQRQRKHYKHKHTRHKSRLPSKSPLAANSSKKNLKPNSSAPQFGVDPSKEIQKPYERNHEDVGIVFSVPPKEERTKKNWKLFAKSPLGFMNFETLPEETAECETEVTDIGDFDSAVALDRELPWKQKSDVVICDPHNSDSRSSFSFRGAPSATASDEMELWPRRGKNSTGKAKVSASDTTLSGNNDVTQIERSGTSEEKL